MTDRNIPQEQKLYTPWGMPYYGPVQRTGDLLWFEHEGKRYPLRPDRVECERNE